MSGVLSSKNKQKITNMKLNRLDKENFLCKKSTEKNLLKTFNTRRCRKCLITKKEWAKPTICRKIFNLRQLLNKWRKIKECKDKRIWMIIFRKLFRTIICKKMPLIKNKGTLTNTSSTRIWTIMINISKLSKKEKTGRDKWLLKN